MFSNLVRLGSSCWQNTVAILSTVGSLYASRFWLLAYFLAGLLFLVAGIPLVAGIVGQFYPRPDMIVSFYGGLAEKEKMLMENEGASKGEQGDSADRTNLFPDQRTTPFGSLLYRRVLKANPESQGARFVLALAIAREDEAAQAQQQLRILAPNTGGGYPPAHAWIAAEMLGRLSDLTENERSILIKHLEEADQWDGCNPAMRAAYAELLVSQGTASKAIPVLERAAKQDSKYRLKLVELYQAAGMEDKAENLREQLQATEQGKR